MSSPIWLLLGLPLAATMWIWPMPTRLLRVLRALVIILVILAMSGLAVLLQSRAGTVVVVADRSLSMPNQSTATQQEAIRVIHHRMGADDRLAVVSFGNDVRVEHPPSLKSAGEFRGFEQDVATDGSDLGAALDKSLSLIGADSPGRIVVLSDGQYTGGDPAKAMAIAADRGIGVDYRLIQRTTAGDLAIASIDAPMTVSPGESFMLTAWIDSPVAQVMEYELLNGDQVISKGSRAVAAGTAPLVFRDHARQIPGASPYQLRIRPATDAIDPTIQNNSADVLVTTEGPKPILVVSPDERSQFSRLLKAGGLDVVAAQPDRVNWTLAGLSNYSSVILENVPAEKIGFAGMQTLAMWVKETGSGLMLTGGRTSYGPGGYFKSPLDPALPVSMEIRQEQRKFAIAISVTLDRSGSMRQPVGGGLTKMDLANQGTAEVVNLLSPIDEMGVIAVDSSPHEVLPLQTVTDKGEMKAKILSIESTGGGIFVYPALAEAARQLTGAKSGTKHIVLFADAADSEEPGQYQDLLAKCQAAGITCSVIGLGSRTDVDAGLLEDIAKRGGGRIYFTSAPEELPRLFAQDTFMAARSGFQSEPTPIEATPGLTLLAGKPYQIGLPVGGYNLCYLRQGANLAVVTKDEYNAPVVASWQHGAGRVLCYTAQVDGQHTGPIAAWPQLGEYLASLARWTAGRSDPLPANMLLTQEIVGGVNRITLHLDPERQDKQVTAAPAVTVISGSAGAAADKPERQELTMNWVSADRLEVEVPMRSGRTMVASVHVPGFDAVAMPPVMLAYSPEYKPVDSAAGERTLRSLAKSTGGAERLDLSEVWAALPKRPRMVELSSWLLLAAALVFLVEIFERRTGMLSLPGRIRRDDTSEARQAKADRKRQVKPVKVKQTPQPAAAKEAPTAPPAQAEPQPAAPAPAAESDGDMLSALKKARQRATGRTDKK